jgi:hypothetical protein
VGCILVELCTVSLTLNTSEKCRPVFVVRIVFKLACMLLLQGEALFQTHENLEHLAMMERVLGPLPQQILKRVE